MTARRLVIYLGGLGNVKNSAFINAILFLLGIPQVSQRTVLINAVRGHFAGFGRVASQEFRNIHLLNTIILEEGNDLLCASVRFREMDADHY